jgi:hypothetical protein
LREIARLGEVSRNQLVGNHQPIRTENVDEALQLLIELNVLKKTNNAERCKYALHSPDAGGPKDFLVLGSWKKVNMSPEGNRAVRLRIKLMAVRVNVASRPCGSLIYTDKTSAPKFRLGPAWRINPADGKKTGIRFDILKREKNDLVFKLNFDPALAPGEIVDYGFYIWTKNHYAMSHKEVLEKYNDEWSREGLNVSDPSMFLEIIVDLPEEFRYREARVEKNPVLTKDGPNVPGAVVSTFKPDERTLAFNMEKPSSGNYFVSWKPP